MSSTPGASSHVAVFPGSFDPLTSGHVDIIERGCAIFDRVIVAVLINQDKTPLFTVQERVAMIKDVFQGRPNVEVDTFDGLLVEYARRKRAHALIRGLRAVSDFEYEFQMVGMNQRLAPDIETVFLMADPRHQAIASRLVKEIASFGGDVSSFTTPTVAAALRKRFEGKHSS